MTYRLTVEHRRGVAPGARRRAARRTGVRAGLVAARGPGAPGPPEAVGQERPGLRRPRPPPGCSTTPSLRRRAHRLRLLLPRGRGHLLPERRPRRRGRPAPPDEAQPPGGVRRRPRRASPTSAGRVLLAASVPWRSQPRPSWPPPSAATSRSPPPTRCGSSTSPSSTWWPSPPASCCGPSAAPPPPTCRSPTGSSSSPASASLFMVSGKRGAEAGEMGDGAHRRCRSPLLAAYTRELHGLPAVGVLGRRPRGVLPVGLREGRRAPTLRIPWYQLSILPFVLGDPALRPRARPGRQGSAPEEVVLSRPDAAGDRRGVGGRVRPRRLHGMSDRRGRGPADARARDRVGPHRVDARPTWCGPPPPTSWPRPPRRAAAGRRRPRARAGLRRRRPERRRPGRRRRPASPASSSSTSSAASSASPAGTSLDELLRALVPQGCSCR